jgi:hypothetical protein
MYYTQGVVIWVLALMDKFHEAPPEGLFLQNQNDSMGDWRSLSARTPYYPAASTIKNAYFTFDER